VARLVEGIGFETLLALKVKVSPICLMGARRPRKFTVEKTAELFLGNIIINNNNNNNKT
jgi:hypothetical protein